MKLLNYIKNSCFVRSFKELDRRLFWVMALEVLLIISIVLVFLFSSLFLKSSIDDLGITDEFIEKINANLHNQTFSMSLMQEQVKYLSLENFSSFPIKTGYNIILALIMIALLFSFFKSLEWFKITRKKFSKVFFKKYFGLFLIWNVSWILLFLIIALGFKDSFIDYSIWAWFLFFIYFSFLIYPMLTKEEKVFKAIKKTFKLGFIKLYKFILPFINIWILLQLGYIILTIFSKIPPLAALFLVLFIPFYISWIKFYMLLVVENVKQ